MGQKDMPVEASSEIFFLNFAKHFRQRGRRTCIFNKSFKIYFESPLTFHVEIVRVADAELCLGESACAVVVVKSENRSFNFSNVCYSRIRSSGINFTNKTAIVL